MYFELSDRARKLASQLDDFMQSQVFPVEALHGEQLEAAENRWATPPIMAELKAKAKAAGLWNLFIPADHAEHGGAGLSHLEYAPSAQQERWLQPLLAGDDYLVNGRKWFITGAIHENCEILIVMGKSDEVHMMALGKQLSRRFAG